jgi:phospholipid transport system substrate-binding protein
MQAHLVPFLAGCAALLLAGLPCVAPAARAEEPEQLIERLDAVLVEIMQRADELGYDGRFERVTPVVREIFDLEFMARSTIGPHWTRLSESERERWVETFAGFTISNFADRFDGYSGETFEIVGRRPASHQTIVVQTRLNRPAQDAVSLDYRMLETPAGWKVVDVYSGGNVSEVALRRSEYAAVLKQGGIEKLIASVSSKLKVRATP